MRHIKILSVPSLLIFALAEFTSCGKKEAHQAEVLRPVRYVQVYATGGSRIRTFSGAAKAGIESNLSFKVAGTVESVDVRVGDKVRSGALIASLDATDHRLQVQQAEAGLTQARAGLRNAEATYERVRAMYENNNASKDDLDNARAGFEAAEGQSQAAEKQLELARLQLSYTRLTAPIAGSIASVNIETNENVMPGRPVVLLTSGANIEVKIGVPEVLISNIRQGDKVKVTFDAIPNKSYDAVVREVGVASTQYATTFPVTARLEDTDSQIRSGMAAEVAFSFETSDQQERIIVPSFAVAEDREGRFVFTVTPAQGDTGTVQRKEVQIGALTDDGLEILDGLSEGDLVVTAGVSKIKNGQRVRL